jgi:hypothetical protein
MKRTCLHTNTNADELKIGGSQNKSCEFHPPIKKTNYFRMKKAILTISISFMFFLELLAQTPNILPFQKSIEKPDLLKNDLSLNSERKKEKKSQANDSEGSGTNFYILPEYESWLVWWHSYNYLSVNNIKPSVFHSPSIAVKYGRYTYKLGFQVAENLSSMITASTNAASFISFQASSDLSYSKTKESKNLVIDSKVQYGRLKGTGTWIDGLYADTVSFEKVSGTFNVDSKSLMVSCMIGFKGKKPSIGLKFINYNTPAYMVSTDTFFFSHNPEDYSIWCDIKDTKFTHFFLVVDPLALALGRYLTNEPCTKKTEVKFQGHWYYMFGLGFAKNDTIGTVFTTSIPFESYGTTSGILENSMGSEWDLGVKITTRIGKDKNNITTRIEEAAHFRAVIGFRYTNWSIISWTREDLQLRSNELYWGPYLRLALQF